MPLRFSYSTLLLVVVALAFFAIAFVNPFLGGSGWFCLVLTIGIGALLRWKKKGLPVAMLSAAVLIAHVNGYKIYGSPEVVPVALVAPVTIDRVELPNTLVLSDGSTRKLHGIKFLLPLSLRVDESTLPTIQKPRQNLFMEEQQSAEAGRARMWATLHPRRRLNLKVGDSLQADLIAKPDGSVDGSVLRYRDYWCGNSFFARFFPRNLPSAWPQDLGVLFVQAGIADPENRDEAFYKKLKEAEMLRYAYSF
jgi:hypothetical protein